MLVLHKASIGSTHFHLNTNQLTSYPLYLHGTEKENQIIFMLSLVKDSEESHQKAGEKSLNAFVQKLLE